MPHLIQPITSQKNPKVQFWKNLQKRSFRLEHKQFLVESVKMVEEALASGWIVQALLIKEEKVDFFSTLIAACNAPVYALASHVFDSLSAAKAPQGIMAAVSLPDQCPLTHLGQYIIVLDEVQDPGNVGTILRTADAAGFTGALLSSSCADVFSSKTLRSTMGSIFHLPMAIVQNLPEAMAKLKKEKVQFIGSALGAPPFFARPLQSPPLGLVVGNEGNGISQQVLAQCQVQYALPMEGKAESLNVSIAAAIMMYDIVRCEKALP